MTSGAGEVKELIFVILARLLDSRVHASLANQPQIMRALNVLMFRILNNAYGCRSPPALPAQGPLPLLP